METATAVIMLIAACAASVSAFFSYYSVEATRAVAGGKLVIALLSKYWSRDMFRYLEDLGSIDYEDMSTVTQLWLHALEGDDEDRLNEALRIDESRREVKSYFETAARLYRAKYIQEEGLRELLQVQGVFLYLGVVAALENARATSPRCLEIEKLVRRKVENYGFQNEYPRVVVASTEWDEIFGRRSRRRR